MKIAFAVSLCLYSSQVLAGLIPSHHKVQYYRGLSRSFGPEITKEYKNMDSLYRQSFRTEPVNPEQVAIDYARTLTSSEFNVVKAYRSDLNGVTHVYLRQKINGLEVFNGNININVDRWGQVVSYGNSFAPHQSQPTPAENQWIFSLGSPKDIIGPGDAIKALMSFVKKGTGQLDLVQLQSFKEGVMMFENVPFALSPVELKQGYIQLENGALQLVWDIQYELQDNWYNGHIHAYDGTVLSLFDWVSSSAAYNVIPFTFNDPLESPRKLLKDPQDAWASPSGWHTQGSLKFNNTIGNNVYAHTNPDGGNEWETNHRPNGVEQDGDLVFDFEANFDQQDPKQYEDAAVTNLFYWCNMAHDFFYRYGFDEKAGNFQQDNLERSSGGGNDGVIANAQDGSGRNNANFATPPDGKHGKMRMYIWDQTSPMRDGDFESGIVIHEYTHGVSTRLTGGAMDSNCLGYGESGGMGEGWGDFIATVIRMSSSDTRQRNVGMGNYANGGQGIRKYLYSTSMSTNPSTYKIMDRFDYWGVHAKGEVWAEMLYEVYWNLVDRLGFTPDWFPPVPNDVTKKQLDEQDLQSIRNHVTSHGNTLAVQLVMDGLKLQPCNPSFVDARDAILQAEQQLTGGDYHCDIYKAFAKRGLGVGATLQKRGWLEQRIESYTLPSICKQ
ncbi:Fungalysin metallopeptidase-domain-containing protein [Sporodiniella umbellata]|nr:Fungalysin metallopeptidase-domain-containing protein [Sporodiniella umbellata]